MRIWHIARGTGIAGLRQTPREPPMPGPGEVRIRLHAATLNYRDLLLANHGSGGAPFVPGSDGAGEVTAVGPDTSRFRVGDRVMPTFYPDWQDGPPTAATTARGLGGGADGVLAQEIVQPEHGLVALPASLSYETAACLPCAGLTAWHALFGEPGLVPGDRVLLLGTGGVSTLALQLAVAVGLDPVVTSSDDAKLERARALGARHTINYRRTPDWDAEAVRLTGGEGVARVLDVGGEGTLARSIAALRPGGTVAMIGGLSGSFRGEIPPFALIGGGKRVVGVLVGPRRMAEDLVRFVAQAGLVPVVDRRFAFDEVPAAYAALAAAGHVGKLAIAFDA